jgi:hypothetical protein
VAPAREADAGALDPVGPLRRHPLLEERLFLDAVDVALEQHRAPVHASKRGLAHRDEVVDDVELGVARSRKEHLVRVADPDLVAV